LIKLSALNRDEIDKRELLKLIDLKVKLSIQIYYLLISIGKFNKVNAEYIFELLPYF